MTPIVTRLRRLLRCSLPLVLGLAAPAARAAEGPWSWLLGLPDWLPPALLVLLGALAGAALLWWLPRRDDASARRSGLGGVGGALAGALLALLLADSWQAFLLRQVEQLPPSAAGKPPAGVRMNLLDEAEAGAPLPPLLAKEFPGRSRNARFKQEALQADVLDIALFDDSVYVAQRERVVQDARGGLVWVGRIEGKPDSEVVLSARGPVLMGSVAVDGRSFEIVFAGGSTHAVRELDPDAVPDEYEPEAFDVDNGGADIAADGGGTDPGASPDSSGQVIDLMVVYTPKARSNAGGVAGIETRIMNAVTRANQAYLNSQVHMQLNVVYMGEVSYVETGMVQSLNDLRGTTDGKMDGVHSLRNSVGADQVALISADRDYCGYASVMTSPTTAFAPYAFAVVHDDSYYNCLGSNNTLAHELGHNQGNVHNAQNASFPGAYPHSYGWRECGVFRTVMSYSCSGEVRIPYFANPAVSYNGRPTGVAGSADTARSMNDTAPIVASFRTPSSVSSAPAAPTGLVASAVDAGTIDLDWSDASADESGFRVQRSSGGGAWSEIAALPANATSFTSTGLSGATGYAYRVYAYNSIGNSAYSNTAQATTPGSGGSGSADTTPPSASLSLAEGAVLSANTTIKGTAQDNVSIARMSLALDGSVVASVVNPGPSGSLSYSLNVKKLKAGSHSLVLTATDSAGLSTSVTRNFSK